MKSIGLVFLTFGVFACSQASEEPASSAASPGRGTLMNLGAISVMVPEAWVTQTSSSSMRKAQFALPRQAGDSEDGELVVFYFGTGNAGTVEANLARWRGQMQDAAGETRKSSANGMPVTTLDVTGSYAASMGPMMQAGPEKPDFRMIASIVESRAGAYYFKLTGPKQTVGHWHSTFELLIASAKAS